MNELPSAPPYDSTVTTTLEGYDELDFDEVPVGTLVTDTELDAKLTHAEASELPMATANIASGIAQSRVLSHLDEDNEHIYSQEYIPSSEYGEVNLIDGESPTTDWAQLHTRIHGASAPTLEELEQSTSTYPSLEGIGTSSNSHNQRLADLAMFDEDDTSREEPCTTLRVFGLDGLNEHAIQTQLENCPEASELVWDLQGHTLEKGLCVGDWPWLVIVEVYVRVPNNLLSSTLGIM